VKQSPVRYPTVGRTRLRHEATMTFEGLDPKLVASLKLEVREADRSGRWMWQLVDVRNGTLFERAFEFEGAGEAQRSGLARLAELTPTLSGAKIARRSISPQPTNRLVIVSRKEEALYQELRRLFADSSSVDVIVDRRYFERRRREAAGSLGRRLIERRSGRDRRVNCIDVAMQARGWWTLTRAVGEPATARGEASA